MKKLLVAVLLLMTFVFVACGSPEVADGEEFVLDVETVGARVMEEITFVDLLAPLDTEMVPWRYQCDENTVGWAWVGSGATAEEFAIFQIVGEDDSAALSAALEYHLAEVRESFSVYLPDEVEKIDDAVVKQYGNYWVLLISDDNRAESRLDKIIEECIAE